MVFAEPWWLVAFLALPMLAAFEAWAVRRDHARVARLVARPLWSRVLERRSPRWRPLRLGLLLLGTAGLVLALARPQWGIVREKVEREGVDVVLALDTSGSMATEDVPPNRFFIARAALSSLVARLAGDRFGLLAFEGEAYPLVPLTLDADAIGLFLETVEPGIVPAPGTSLGVGLGRGLSMFVDKERHNRVMVLVSDGEDLEGEVEEAVRKAKEAGVVVHTVGVGTEAGQPVPDFDREGRSIGFKKDQEGGAVVSRLNTATLDAIARGTGGRFFRITPADTSLSALAAAIEGLEQKTLAREFSYRRKERFQVPLAVGLGAVAAALLLPLPRLRAAKRAGPIGLAAGLILAGWGTSSALAQTAPASDASPVASPAPPAAAPTTKPGVLDEVLMRPRRLAAEGRSDYERGNHPAALQSFERAAALRPGDPAARYNMADGLYKNGKYPEAATLYRSLAEDARSPLAAPSRYNLGNTLFQQQDYKNAINAYRDALRITPDDLDTLRKLETALRALKRQEDQQKKKEEQEKNKQEQDKDQKGQGQDKEPKGGQKPEGEKKPQEAKDQKPETPEEKEQKRFQQEAGMPKDRAMQLLDALQQNEKNEQKKLLAAKRAARKKGKDW
jgi:Ca-activated chloride channel family protein